MMFGLGVQEIVLAMLFLGVPGLIVAVVAIIIKNKVKRFYVYEHPKYGQKIESSGFTLLGFLFPFIWLTVKKLYAIAVITFLLMFSTIIFDKVFEEILVSRLEELSSISYNDLAEIERFQEIYWHENMKNFSHEKS